MDLDLIRHAIEHAAGRDSAIEEALTHWRLAGGSAAGAGSAHWLSIAFGVARLTRDSDISKRADSTVQTTAPCADLLLSSSGATTDPGR
jgi:hypothetical protein